MVAIQHILLDLHVVNFQNVSHSRFVSDSLLVSFSFFEVAPGWQIIYNFFRPCNIRNFWSPWLKHGLSLYIDLVTLLMQKQRRDLTYAK